ncbi:MAG TPA: S8 family serine peptidase [Pyrinomonadaceae bacterium]|nr:S8 family serine peptidase [Pyrinomonadaceae bacterium]
MSKKADSRRRTRSEDAGVTEPTDSASFGRAVGERELVVIAYPDAGLRAADGEITSVTGADVSPLAELMLSEGVTLEPLFGLGEDRLILRAAAAAETSGVDLPDLSVYYRVEAPDARLEEIAERLRGHEAVETAFIKPPAEPPQFLNDMAPSVEPAPPATSDFTTRQGYLNAAPGGIDARFAWTRGGGSGMGSRIIDIEGAWRFSHEDLMQNQGGVVGGEQNPNLIWRNHGTAVVGEFSGDRNGLGVTGICPDANVRAISVFGDATGWGSAAAIRLAADMLSPGDIILIELHRAGPRLNFQPRTDQRGYIAIEWWPDDMAAIRYAVGRGVIVVEAGGNGAENLDDAIYDVNPPAPHGPFPAAWRNPFRRNLIDTGAIVVGAGAPPPGTHGRNHGPDRSRLDFSNHGSMFDVQAWGREVTTCGYGDLQGGGNEDLWYTDQFSGTSSASPIVVGSLGCVQGILRAAARPLLTPARARALFRSTGSPQQDGPAGPRTQRIGSRPDIRQMINSLMPAPPAVTEDKVESLEVKPEGNGGEVIINISGQVTVNVGVGG